MERGEIYWVDLGDHADEEDDETVGSEQSKRRPALIVKNDSEGHEPMTVVVPLTSGTSDDGEYLSTVYIPETEHELDGDSIALTSQIRAIDSDERVLNKAGELSRKKLKEVEKSLEVVLKLY